MLVTLEMSPSMNPSVNTMADMRVCIVACVSEESSGSLNAEETSNCVFR